VRYRVLYILARKITTCILAHRPIRFAIQMCDIGFCISWPEKSQHASSHIDRFDSPFKCAISGFVSLGQKNHNMHHRASTDSIRKSNVRYRVLYLLARKITTCIIAHRLIRFASRCAISVFVSLGQKITTCIIAHRPIRFASRCAISGFVSLGQKITTCIIAHNEKK